MFLAKRHIKKPLFGEAGKVAPINKFYKGGGFEVRSRPPPLYLARRQQGGLPCFLLLSTYLTRQKKTSPPILSICLQLQKLSLFK